MLKHVKYILLAFSLRNAIINPLIMKENRTSDDYFTRLEKITDGFLKEKQYHDFRNTSGKNTKIAMREMNREIRLR